MDNPDPWMYCRGWRITDPLGSFGVYDGDFAVCRCRNPVRHPAPARSAIAAASLAGSPVGSPVRSGCPASADRTPGPFTVGHPATLAAAFVSGSSQATPPRHATVSAVPKTRTDKAVRIALFIPSTSCYTLVGWSDERRTTPVRPDPVSASFFRLSRPMGFN